jgi:hypothetical protein
MAYQCVNLSDAHPRSSESNRCATPGVALFGHVTDSARRVTSRAATRHLDLPPIADVLQNDRRAVTATAHGHSSVVDERPDVWASSLA